MIRMNYSQGLLLYLLVWLVVLVFLWGREFLRLRHRDWKLSKKKLFHCRQCHFSFLNRQDDGNMTRCPRCNAVCLSRKE